jgi:hypothetical protein
MEEPFANPAAMTPAQRRQEIAAILARGVLRLRQIAPTSPGTGCSRTAEESAESRGNRLDDGPETSPHALAR